MVIHMTRSESYIRTSHAGTLPPVAEATVGVIDAESTQNPRSSQSNDPAGLAKQVAEVVRKQLQIGIDCVGDGEFWNARNFLYYGQQLSGVTSRELRAGERGSGRESTRERDEFPKLYGDMDRVGTLFCVPGEEPRHFPSNRRMVVTGPLKGRVTDALLREINVFQEALKGTAGCEEAFICVPGPGWLNNFIFNEYYGSEEELAFALAAAMRDEYRAVVDAGFILQIDDPALVTAWDMIKPEPPLQEYRRRLRILCRCPQSCSRGNSRGSNSPAFLLGQLAWRTHPRPAFEGGHRPDPPGQHANVQF